MPLLIDSVSKIRINNSLIVCPNRELLYRELSGRKAIMLKKSEPIASKKYYINKIIHNDIKWNDMTTEQKRKYLLLKYIRQYT